MPVLAPAASPKSSARHDAAGCALKHGESVTTRLEKRFVAWGTPRVPSWLQTDHLTRLTLLWGAGNIGFAMLAASDSRWLLGIAAMIAMQYLTDLFDGAVGRARDTGLVRWGFYADHLLDTLFLGSLCLAGAIVSPPSLALWWMGLAIVSAAIMASSFLAFGATGKFEIYKAGVGPTEARGLLIALIAVVAFTGTGHFWWSVPALTVVTTASLIALAIHTGRVLRTLDMDAKWAASNEKSPAA